MRKLRLAIPALSLWLAGCAAGTVTVDTGRRNGDYVEVSNPAYTMAPGAPATIWVPRSSVESGPPRGGVLVKEGVETVVNEIKGGQQAPPRDPASAPVAPSR